MIFLLIKHAVCLWTVSYPWGPAKFQLNFVLIFMADRMLQFQACPVLKVSL